VSPISTHVAVEQDARKSAFVVSWFMIAGMNTVTSRSPSSAGSASRAVSAAMSS
jgi:hypothetical protein